MEVVICSLRLKDAQALAELVWELGEFSSITREAPALTLERARQNLGIITSSDRHTLLVAEEEGQLVGYVSTHWHPMMSQPVGCVSELFVKASHRGQGIGIRLLEHIEAEAMARGCGRLALENSKTKASYTRGYYAKHGWQERPAAASFILDLRADR